MFKIYDGRDKFWQWDLDRKLIVDDASITRVHFSNNTSADSLVVETYQEDGLTLANVPNILLQTSWDIYVYACDSNYTKYEKNFEVVARTKPTDYVYTETEVLRWETLENEIHAGIAEMEEATAELQEEIIAVEHDVNESLGVMQVQIDEIQGEVETGFDSVNEAILNLYPTDRQNGNMEIYVDMGAAQPLKELYFYNLSNDFHITTKAMTICRCGKNMMNPAQAAYVIGETINADGSISQIENYAYTEKYTPVLPNTDYVFSGKIVSTSMRNRVAFYDNHHNFISSFTPEPGTPAQFTTPASCCFIRYNVSKKLISDFITNEAMLEVGTTATRYEAYRVDEFVVQLGAYYAYKTVNITTGTVIDKDGQSHSFTPVDIFSQTGVNHIYSKNVLQKKNYDCLLDTITASVRLEPSLIYNKLKAGGIV